MSPPSPAFAPELDLERFPVHEVSPAPGPIPVPLAESEDFDPYAEPSRPGLLAVLCLSHFYNDFCLGVTSPMIPTMERQYGWGLGGVALIVSLMGLMANVAQPPAGWFMARCRTPWLLLVCPFLCALSFWIGFLDSPWQAMLTLLLAGTAVGAFHPVAFLLAQTALPRSPSLSTAIFISAGFLGVSAGTMTAGHWMEAMGFADFHWLYLGAFGILLSYLATGAHRIRLERYLAAPREHAGPSTTTLRVLRIPTIPFWLLLVVGTLVTFQMSTTLFFTPKLFQVLYGSEGKGGNAVFVFGVLGGLSSYFYAWLADRGNAYRVAAWAQVAAFGPLLAYSILPSAAGKFVAVFLLGITLGGTFPVLAALARTARGMNVGMRTSLVLGGCWGLATVINLGFAQLPDLGVALEDVVALAAAGPPLAIPILVFASRRYWSGSGL